MVQNTIKSIIKNKHMCDIYAGEKTITDFHSHILPGIDDGSSSVEESIAMLKMEADQGIRHVIATPHFYPSSDFPEQFLKNRTAAEKRLREHMAGYSWMPKVSVGAEVHYFPGISDSHILKELTIAKSDYILIEMPQSPWSRKMYQELDKIYTKQGITPIIAHVDRYVRPFRTFGILDYLTGLPVLVQANASFFLQNATAMMAFRLLKDGKIHLLGSDCHNLDGRRPNLGPAVQRIERKLGREAVCWLLEQESKIFSAEKTFSLH